MRRFQAHIIKALVVLASLAVSTFLIADRLTVDGDVSKVLKGRSDAYEIYLDFQQSFTTGHGDTMLAVFANDLDDTLIELEDLVLELQLSDTVVGVTSVFSFRDPKNPSVGFLSSVNEEAAPGGSRLEALLEAIPAATDVLARSKGATLIIIAHDLSATQEQRKAAIDAAVETADPALRPVSIGPDEIESEISRVLQSEQVILSGLALLLSVGLIFVFFRSVGTALVCAVPSIVGLTWNFGLLALSGIPFDPMLAVLPTLMIVLSFADTIHIYHAIMRCAKTQPLEKAIRKGLRQTAPAAAFTSLTTAMAFGALLVLGSPTLATLSTVAIVGLFVQLGAVLWLTPALMSVLGGRATADMKFPKFERISFATLNNWKITLILTSVLFVTLGGIRTQVDVTYQIDENIPRSSELKETLSILQEMGLASGRLFVQVMAADTAIGLQQADVELISAVSAVLYSEPLTIDLARMHQDGDDVISQFSSSDGSSFALPVAFAITAGGEEILDKVRTIEAGLAQAGLSSVTQMTGEALVSVQEIPRLVEDLRMSFYVAVILVIGVVAILTKSVKIAALSLVPNLLPIFGVEAGLVLIDRPLTLTGAIALMVAFGIAVDDSIHFLNRYRLACRTNEADTAILKALMETIPPVATTSVIVSAGFAVTTLSTMPSVASFGGLVAAAIVIAFLADILVLPSLLKLAERKGSWKQ